MSKDVFFDILKFLIFSKAFFVKSEIPVTIPFIKSTLKPKNHKILSSNHEKKFVIQSLTQDKKEKIGEKIELKIFQKIYQI